MKSLTLPRVLGLMAAVLLASAAANAVTITASSLLGSWDPGSKYNNDVDAAVATNKLITWENGGANPNPDPEGAVFALGAGFAGALPTPAVFGGKDDNSADGFGSINNALYSYVLAKYGNVTYVYYLGNLALGNYELALTGPNGNGLSHQTWYTPGSTPGTSVPDGGSTVALLGLALGALALIRRKIAS